MSKINSMMDVGRRAMMNSQTALQTVGHNIANKSTEGYSRQRVDIVSNEPVTLGGLRLGMGSRAATVSRTNNPYLEKQIANEQAQQGYLQGKSDALMRVEQVYNEQINKGLNTFMADFFNTFRELANSPESLATRSLVKETAQYLTKDFKRVDKQLDDVQRDIDQQLATQIEEVNQMTKEIATLNEKIQSVEITGSRANDERDRRDLLLKKLGERINIRYAEGEDSKVTVSAGNSALLVAGYESKTLLVKATPENANKDEGCFDIFYLPSDRAEPIKVTEQMSGGSIGGLLEVRDKVITDMRGRVDSMAAMLAQNVNDIHKMGFDSFNKKGTDFFVAPLQVRHAAANLKVNQEILDDPSRIATAAAPFAPGDNRIANGIASLQYQKVVNGGVSTLDEFYNSMVGQVGVMTSRTNVAAQSQQDILKQLNNIRESISGVSLDEETTKMIEFQKSFDASARLIRTADELFDTVLNLKRM